MIRLTTERLIIRDPQPTDIDVSASLFTNPVVRQYLGGVRSIEEALNGLRHSIEAENEYPLSVHLRATNEFIGLVSISPHHDPKDMEISYMFLPEYQGNGFARETIGALLGFCKQELRLRRVVSETQTANERSCRLLENLGYTAESRIERFGAEQTIYVYDFSKESIFSIEQVTESTRAFVDNQVAESWAGPYSVSRGKIHDTRTDHGFVAVEDGNVVGYALYLIIDDECEIAVLESLCEKQGIGSALINAVVHAAKEKNCRRVWLITTNDNIHAIRFYQRFGFELKAVHINAMEDARKLKPQIPLTGNDRIPIKHEFEFEMVL